MLGVAAAPPITNLFVRINKPSTPPLLITLQTQLQIRNQYPIKGKPDNLKVYQKFKIRARNNDGLEERNRIRENGLFNDGNSDGNGNGNGDGNGGDGLKGEKKKKEKFNLSWKELIFDPDPNNVAAVGLTGLLTWASVQILWQLVLVSLAIVVSALKYSFIATLLIFILITLL